MRLLMLLLVAAVVGSGCGGEDEPTIGVGQSCLDTIEDQFDATVTFEVEQEAIATTCDQLTGDTPVDEAVADAEDTATGVQSTLDENEAAMEAAQDEALSEAADDPFADCVRESRGTDDVRDCIDSMP